MRRHHKRQKPLCFCFRETRETMYQVGVIGREDLIDVARTKHAIRVHLSEEATIRVSMAGSGNFQFDELDVRNVRLQKFCLEVVVHKKWPSGRDTGVAQLRVGYAMKAPVKVYIKEEELPSL